MIFIGSSEEMAVYKDAQKYMERYLAGKYSEYVSKKKRVISHGKTSERDSKVSKLYKSFLKKLLSLRLGKLYVITKKVVQIGLISNLKWN